MKIFENQWNTLKIKQKEEISTGERMGEELGCLISTLVTTNGRPKSRSKMQSYTPELGRVKATSRSNPLSPITGTPYVSMEANAEHVQYQLPNQHSRVGFL
jgi:hypothetical protein